MILVVVKSPVEPELADEFIEAVGPSTSATRTELDNEWFEWSHGVEDPNGFVLVETFNDDAAEAYATSDHFRAGLETTRPFLTATPKIVPRAVDGDDQDAMGELRIDWPRAHYPWGRTRRTIAITAAPPTITMAPAPIKMVGKAGPSDVVAVAGAALLGGVLRVGIVSGVFTTCVGVGVTFSDRISVASGVSVVCVGVADSVFSLYFRLSLRGVFFLPELSDSVIVGVALLVFFPVPDELDRFPWSLSVSPLPMGSP